MSDEVIAVGAVLVHSPADRPFAATRPLEVAEVTLSAPGPREVLVAIEAASICHSDLSVVNGDRPRPLPMLLGHEAAGRVVGRGDAVRGVEVGQRVVMTFLPRCEECAACRTQGVQPCMTGSATNESGELLDGGSRIARDGVFVRHHLGVSGFATHAVVDERSVVPVGDDVPAAVAALLGCAVLTGGGAVLNAGRPQIGETVAVVGLGGVGMAALLTAQALDGVEVIGIDHSPAKLDEAHRLGAVAVHSPDEAIAAGLQAAVVIEAAGHPRAFETALAVTGPGGRLVTVGLPPRDAIAQVSPLALVAGGRTIIGSYLGSAVPQRDIPVFVDMWREGRLPVEQLITATIPLDQINEGFDRLADGTALRQIVDVRRTTHE